MANNPLPMDDASANNSGSNTDPNNLLNETQSGLDNEAEAALGFMAARVRLQRKLAGLGSGAALDDVTDLDVAGLDVAGLDNKAAVPPDTSALPTAQPPIASPSVQPLPQPPSFPSSSSQQSSGQTSRFAQKQPLRGHPAANYPTVHNPAARPPNARPPATNQSNGQGYGHQFPLPATPPVSGGISRSRAIDANNRAHGTPAIAQPGTPSPHPGAPPTPDLQNGQNGKSSKLFFWKKKPPLSANGVPVDTAVNGAVNGGAVNGAVPWPAGSRLPDASFPQGSVLGSGPSAGFPAGEAFPTVRPLPPKLWERQPYSAIAHTLAIVGTVTGAWFFGILVAQFLPGSITQPPLQEALLRKSNRLARSLWHLPELWQTPTAQTRIEAIPLPETGPVLAPINLSPIERQPLIDELNAIETEIITLDRRLQGLEKKLGKPPYQGTDIDNRVNALRGAIDPSPRTTPETSPTYTPTPRNPADDLLDVAELKIFIPSDALFTPGQDQIKDAALLTSVLDQLVNYSDATIVIRSYSDDQASALDSRGYTLKQANALGAYLQAALPTTHRWVTIGAGLSQPIASNDTEANRQQNRRIEILVDTRARRY